MTAEGQQSEAAVGSGQRQDVMLLLLTGLRGARRAVQVLFVQCGQGTIDHLQKEERRPVLLEEIAFREFSVFLNANPPLSKHIIRFHELSAETTQYIFHNFLEFKWHNDLETRHPWILIGLVDSDFTNDKFLCHYPIHKIYIYPNSLINLHNDWSGFGQSSVWLDNHAFNLMKIQESKELFIVKIHTYECLN